jgi:hypothetical protein
MSYNGRDAWPGYHPDPIAFHIARHRGYGRVREYADDPINAALVSLALWADEPVELVKHGKRKYRRWRLAGLLALTRPLTAAEEQEVDALIEQYTASRRKRREKALPETTDTENRSTT